MRTFRHSHEAKEAVRDSKSVVIDLPNIQTVIIYARLMDVIGRMGG